MSDKEYILTIDELALQIHRVLRDLYPSIEISGDKIRKFIILDNLNFHFLAQMFASEYKFDSDQLIKEIYLELMVEYEKNWHDRVFFKILKDNEKISFEMIEMENG